MSIIAPVKRVIALLLFLLISINHSTAGYFKPHEIGCYVDSQGVVNLPLQGITYNQCNSSDFNIGFSKNSHWFKFKPSSNCSFFKINNSEIDSLEIFFLLKESTVIKKSAGSLISFNSREIKNRYPVFSIPATTEYIYVKIKSELKIDLSFEFLNSNELHSSYTIDLLLFALLNTIFLIMLIYNSFLFFHLKQRIYALYSAYLLSLIATSLCITGYVYQFVLVENYWINYYATNLSVSFMLITFCLFTREALQLNKNQQWINNGLIAMAIIGLTCMTLTFIVPRALVVKLLHVFPIIAMLLALAGAIVCIKKGFKPAKYYLIGWSCFLVGALFVQINAWIGLPNNIVLSNLSFIGAALESIFFSYTISTKMRDYLVQIDSSNKKIELFEDEVSELRSLLLKRTPAKIREHLIDADTINNYLLSPLSEREVEVLQLIATGKTNKVVADELHVSINTIKTHIKNIYEKLGASNRTEAVNKASALDLIS